MEPIIVRGAGDIATGTIHRLCSSGYSVIMLETNRPSAIRRNVAFCEAVYDGRKTVEGITCLLVSDVEEAYHKVTPKTPVLLVDENCKLLKTHHPAVLIDGILAKKNLGTTRDMADLTIALGPGFEAGVDVDYVVETKRGHDLGRVITNGFAIANTGIPGMIGGYGAERVIHASAKGNFYGAVEIGNQVQKEAQIGTILQEDGTKNIVKAQITGTLRGLIRDDYPVTKGFKIADIDPRQEAKAYCDTISDKARCIAGSVLELVVAHEKGSK